MFMLGLYSVLQVFLSYSVFRASLLVHVTCASWTSLPLPLEAFPGTDGHVSARMNAFWNLEDCYCCGWRHTCEEQMGVTPGDISAPPPPSKRQCAPLWLDLLYRTYLPSTQIGPLPTFIDAPAADQWDPESCEQPRFEDWTGLDSLVCPVVSVIVMFLWSFIER